MEHIWSRLAWAADAFLGAGQAGPYHWTFANIYCKYAKLEPSINALCNYVWSASAPNRQKQNAIDAIVAIQQTLYEIACHAIIHIRIWWVAHALEKLLPPLGPVLDRSKVN